MELKVNIDRYVVARHYVTYRIGVYSSIGLLGGGVINVDSHSCTQYHIHSFFKIIFELKFNPKIKTFRSDELPDFRISKIG